MFNQSYFGDGQIVAQRDGYPVCEGRGTWRWDPGELITDEGDSRQGRRARRALPAYTGFYLEDTFERLPVLDEAGNRAG